MLLLNRLCWTIWAIVVVAGELAIVHAEPFRSKRAFRQ